MEDPLTKRRWLLQTAGASGTALLAGCSGLLDSQESDETPAGDDTPSDDDTPTGDSSDGSDGDGGDGSDGDAGIDRGEGDTREVGIVAEPDQQALTELQDELQAGEIEQQEAIERQQEILQSALDELVDVLQSETDIEVQEEYTQLGAIRASGDPYELIDSLTSPRVSVIVPTDTLETPQQPTG